MLRLIFRALFRSRTKQTKIVKISDLDEPRFRRERPRRVPSALGEASVPVVETVTVETRTQTSIITGTCYVVDGDTIRIGNVSLRLAGIDAPEMDHPWGKKAKWELVQLCKGQIITAKIEPGLSYDRLVATCYLPDGRDLSAEMVRRGLALDWPKFSGGKYASLEPDGVRKKHWKAAARQRGHMHIFNK